MKTVSTRKNDEDIFKRNLNCLRNLRNSANLLRVKAIDQNLTIGAV